MSESSGHSDMPEDASRAANTQESVTTCAPTPALFLSRPISVWLIIGSLIIFVLLSFFLFFETIAPVADFSFQPNVQADSGTYWELSGVRPGAFATQPSGTNVELGNNTLGPVGQAKLFRTDSGILLSNLALLIILLWVVGTMKEFDRGFFTLLLLLNPLLFSSIVTLNKEIFAITGMIVFVRYMTAKKHRGIVLIFALLISFAARWQQMAVMLLLACFESRVSPIRKKPLAGVLVTLLIFTLAYTAIYKLVPNLIAGLLAQASAGRTIRILDAIQGNFGFPLVVIPKILLNVMGRWITPGYFIKDYWSADFSNWHDQIFLEVQELLTTVLLLILLLGRKLSLKDPPVYLLALYFILTAVNPMEQPRYEYPAYVLLCLQASRFVKLGRAPIKENATSDSQTSLVPG
ncbi:MAG TPA: hypothetical protein VF018_05465 [Acidobacteriaceae bacterium]